MTMQAIAARAHLPAPMPANGTAQLAEATPMDAYTAEFLEFLADKSPLTLAAYTTATRQFTAWLAENNIRRPTRTDMIAYRDHLTATRRISTARMYLTAAHMLFRWLAATGRYPDIMAALGLPKKRKTPARAPLTPSQVVDTVTAIGGTDLAKLRDRAIITLMATSGLRCKEVATALVEDFRPIAAPDGRPRPALFIERKGHQEKDDFIIVEPHALAALDAYLAARRAGHPIGDTSPLFASTSPRNRDRHMAPRGISRIVKTALRAAGLDRREWTAHSLRHTAATIALGSGVSLTAVQATLGHEDPATTQIYAHYNAHAASDCETVIGEAIFGTTTQTLTQP